MLMSIVSDDLEARQQATSEAGEAIRVVSEESPEAAGLIARIIASNYEQQLLMRPTWEDLERHRERARQEGFAAGYALAREEIYARLFDGVELRDLRAP
jgi:23S rRNA G2069 N7-methylase RlmK/C1962 C5-methylase RlmI